MVRHTGEDFIDIERIAITTMFFLQAPGIQSAELDAPETDGLPAHSDTPLNQKIFYISVA